MTEHECRCGRPTRDAAYVCDTCTEALSIALGEVPWLKEELEITITRRKGIDYRRVGGGKGGKAAPRSDKRIAGDRTPDPTSLDAPALGAAMQQDIGNWGASEARTHLKATLVLWVRFCLEERVRNASPHRGLPEDDLVAISRWLMWRIDGLALLDIGPEAVDEITDAVAKCHRLIDRPADRQYLGRCESCPEGRLFARPGSAWAKCDTCQSATDAEALRAGLLKELDDRLCTAAEIAHLSTYLGLKADREIVRKRINQWHKRGRITAEHAFAPDPVFRFGDIYERLLAAEYETKVG